MQTAGIVKWFDRSTGVGLVSLADGGEDCLVRLAAAEAADATAGAPGPTGGTALGAGRRGTWRDYVPDPSEAERAGTWGDGGRDY